MKKRCYQWALPLALILWTITIPASLFAAATLFTTSPKLIIDSIDFDDSGDLFYLRTDFDFGAAIPESTKLIRRTVATGYTDPVTVFDYGSRKFGTFVTATSSRVYFGESSDGTIRSVALDSFDSMLHATVPFLYDLAISPGGDAFVSANGTPFGQANEILRVDLGTGVTEAVIDNTNDFSGPIEFDSVGNLFYGGTGSPFAIGAPTDVFRFTGAEIAAAISTTTPIDLSLASPFSTTLGNSHFAFAAGIGLYRHTPDGVPDVLSLIDPLTGSSVPVPGEPGPTFGAIAHNGSSLYGISTDFSSSTSAFVLIPEPSRALLAMIGLCAALFARRSLFTRRL